MNIQPSDSLTIPIELTDPGTAPGAPVPAAESSEIYSLFYIEKPPHIYQKFFKCSGPFKHVIEKGRKYCYEMNYRFVMVKPFIANLDEELQRHSAD